MGKKKALLTLFGGRSFLPIALIVLHERPDIVVAISSEQSQYDIPQLRQAIEKFRDQLGFSCTLEAPDGVDAFDVEKIQSTCENALTKYPDAEWIFDITSGTSLMSIAAYEAAKKARLNLESSVKCWYMNTSHTRVISLVGEKRTPDIFQINVDDYATAYSRELIPGDLEERREQSEKIWLPFAQKVGKNPRYAELLKSVMLEVGRAKQGRPSRATVKDYVLKNSSQEMYNFLEEAKTVGLLEALGRDSASNISLRLSYLQDKFLNGAWLEAYVCDEARKLRIFDDCQWNQRIIDGNNKNELDVAMTYKAQLLIAECKTGDEAFASDTLYQLNAVANMLGNRFVGKLLITSLPRKDASKDFEAKRKGLHIVLATAEDLPDIRRILEKQAKSPDFPRM
jgi:hypothetical protein